MAGVAIWTGGANDGNWSTAGNWGTFSGTPSAPPATGDSVIISTGDRDIDSGLGQSAVTLVGITITEGFQHSIGTQGSSLEINSSGTVKIALAGKFIKLNGTFTASTPKMNVNFRSRGAFALSGGTATNLRLGGAGTAEIAAAAVVTNIKINGTTVTAGANGTGFTTAKIGAGQLTTSRSIATFTGSASKLITMGAAAISTGATLGSGCTMNHQASGTIAELETLAGSSWNADGNTNSSVTITQLYRHANSNVSREYGGNSVTITAEDPI